MGHIAFAKIVVPRLSGHFVVEREYKEALTLQYFCAKGGTMDSRWWS